MEVETSARKQGMREGGKRSTPQSSRMSRARYVCWAVVACSGIDAGGDTDGEAAGGLEATVAAYVAGEGATG